MTTKEMMNIITVQQGKTGYYYGDTFIPINYNIEDIRRFDYPTKAQMSAALNLIECIIDKSRGPRFTTGRLTFRIHDNGTIKIEDMDIAKTDLDWGRIYNNSGAVITYISREKTWLRDSEIHVNKFAKEVINYWMGYYNFVYPKKDTYWYR